MTDSLEGLLRGVFPIEGAPAPDRDTWVSRTLQLVDVEERGGEALATLRLIYFRHGAPDAQGEIENICEQPVLMIPAVHMGDERIAAYLEALREGLSVALDQMPGDLFILPADLMGPPSKHPLSLLRPQTADDFMDALMKKSRLGRFR